MTRKNILSVTVMVFLVTILGLLIMATMPFWLPALMIYPSLISPLSDLIMKRITQQVMSMMFNGKRTPTMPSGIIS